MLVTRGSRGMALFERDRPTDHLPIVGTDQIADVTGAGDTVIATFALALAAGATFREAARLANHAGGLVVMKRGTATVTAPSCWPSSRAVVSEDRLLDMGRSSTTRQLVELVRADRAAGRTVAFANGCFDLLHVGHIRYLEGARREGDRLIVAVNDDESVRRLKGSGRPMLPASGESRAGRRPSRSRLRRRVRRRDCRAPAAARPA